MGASSWLCLLWLFLYLPYLCLMNEVYQYVFKHIHLSIFSVHLIIGGVKLNPSKTANKLNINDSDSDSDK